MNLSDVGNVVAQQMDSIEENMPDDTEAMASLVAVILQSENEPDKDGCRVRISVPELQSERAARELVRGVLIIALERGWI